MTNRQLSLVGLCVYLFAAAPVAGQNAGSAATAADAFVVEKLITRYDIAADGTSKTSLEMRIKVSTPAAVQQFGTVVMPYRRELSTVVIDYVRVRKAGGATIATPASTAIEVPADVTRAAPQYTDSYAKHVNVQGLAVGDTIETAYSVTTKPVFPGHFWLLDEIPYQLPILDGEIRLTAPAAMVLTVKSADLQPTVSESGGRREHLWKYTNPKPLPIEELARKLADPARKPAIQATTFRSWADLGDAFRTLWRGRADVTPDIKKLADELIRGKSTEAERVQAIYRHVSTNIRYVGVSLGVGSIQPHTAAEVLTNGFGDCKDKHILLAALLSAAGIEVQPAFIGVDRIFDADVPSPIAFDHVVTMRPSTIALWMDTTLEVAPLGFLMNRERGKSVLVVPKSGPASIVKTPETPTRPDAWHVNVDGILDGKGVLTAKVVETFTGDAEVILRAAFRTVPQAQWIEVAKEFELVKKFSGTPAELTMTAPEDTESPMTLRYTFTASDYHKWSTKQIVAPMPSLDLPDAKAIADAKEPIALGGASEFSIKTRIQLPAGFAPSLSGAHPQSVKEDRPFASYTMSVALDGQVFTADRRFVVKTDKLPLDQKEAFASFTKAVSDGLYWVDLREPRAWRYGSDVEMSWPSGAQSPATDVVRRGNAARDRNDIRGARDLFDEAVKLDPKHPFAFSTLGRLQFDLGDRDAGILTMRRQLEIQPSAAAYKWLAFYLRTAGRYDEHVALWREAQKAYPDDADMPAMLGEALVLAGANDEAATALARETERRPDSSRLQWQLGTAYLRAGNDAKALPALRKAAELESSPGMLNAIAWELVERNKGLDDALPMSERSVTQIQELINGVALDRLTIEDVRRVTNMAAYIDTLAWIQFKRGDLVNAERNILAAYDLTQSTEIADHAAQIYEAKKDRAKALVFYARAVTAMARPPAAVTQRFIRIEAAAAERERLMSQARSTASQDFTTTVPRPASLQGIGEFFVVVSKTGTITQARWVAGERSVEPMKAALEKLTIRAHLAAGSDQVIRRAVMACSPTMPSCAFVLIAANRVTAIN